MNNIEFIVCVGSKIKKLKETTKMTNNDNQLIEKLKNDKSMCEVINSVYLMSAAALADFIRETYEKNDFETLEEYFASEKLFFHIDGYDFYLGNFRADYVDNYFVVTTDKCFLGVRLCDDRDDKKLIVRLNYALNVAGVELDEHLLVDKIKDFVKKRWLKLE